MYRTPKKHSEELVMTDTIVCWMIVSASNLSRRLDIHCILNGSTDKGKQFTLTSLDKLTTFDSFSAVNEELINNLASSGVTAHSHYALGFETPKEDILLRIKAGEFSKAIAIAINFGSFTAIDRENRTTGCSDNIDVRLANYATSGLLEIVRSQSLPSSPSSTPSPTPS